MTYRMGAVVEGLSSLEESALMLADRLQKTQTKDISQAVKDNERKIANLLIQTGFKKSCHHHLFSTHYEEGDRVRHLNCDNYFLRDSSVAVMRFSTSYKPIFHDDFKGFCRESRLYVIPRGKEILDEIEEIVEEIIPWPRRVFNFFLAFNSAEYNQKFDELCWRALKTPTDSLLYLARSVK